MDIMKVPGSCGYCGGRLVMAAFALDAGNQVCSVCHIHGDGTPPPATPVEVVPPKTTTKRAKR